VKLRNQRSLWDLSPREQNADPRRFRSVRFPEARIADISGLESNTLLQTVLEDLGVGIVVCDAVGKITLVNKAAKQFAQRNPKGRMITAAPNIWGEIYDSNGRNVPATEWPWARALRGQTTLGSEYRLVRPNGEYSDVLFGSSPVSSRQWQNVGALSSMTNITQLKRDDAVLLHNTILNERSRVAAELHDTLVQGLNAVLLQMDAAENEFSHDMEAAQRKMRQVRELARANLTEARRSMWVLSSQSFENEDPAIALAVLARRLFEGIAVELRLHMEKSPANMTSELRFELQRIGKEALTNVARHARATRVRIELVYVDQRARLSVSDNGQGFISPPPSSGRPGFGLFSLRARAERIGGKVSIQSKPGQGTRVSIVAPLSSSGKRDRPFRGDDRRLSIALAG